MTAVPVFLVLWSTVTCVVLVSEWHCWLLAVGPAAGTFLTTVRIVTHSPPKPTEDLVPEEFPPSPHRSVTTASDISGVPILRGFVLDWVPRSVWTGVPPSISLDLVYLRIEPWAQLRSVAPSSVGRFLLLGQRSA